MLRLVRSCFGCITREEPTATCRLPGCALPRFREPSGRAHDFCGRTHADEFHNNQHPARDAACTPANPAPFDATLEYNTPEMLLFWQPPSVFSQWTPSHFVIGGVSSFIRCIHTFTVLLILLCTTDCCCTTTVQTVVLILGAAPLPTASHVYCAEAGYLRIEDDLRFQLDVHNLVVKSFRRTYYTT